MKYPKITPERLWNIFQESKHLGKTYQCDGLTFKDSGYPKEILIRSNNRNLLLEVLTIQDMSKEKFMKEIDRIEKINKKL